MGPSGRRLTASLTAVLAVLVLIGAGAAFGVGRAQRHAGVPQGSAPGTGQPSSPGAELSSPDSSGAGTSASGGDRPTAGAPSDATGIPTHIVTATPPPQATPSEGTPPPASTPSSAGVEPVSISLSQEAAASPLAGEISDLLMRYFTAINRHDYDAWLTTVSTSQATRDRDDWDVGYSTTYDSDIQLAAIKPGKPAVVMLTFVSHQAVEQAPAALRATCIRWKVLYEVVDEGIGLRVGNPADKPSMSPCS